jgi:beta-glucosidase
MKKYFAHKPIVYISAAVLFCFPLSKAVAQTQAEAAKMNTFVSGLMKKMTVDEKIGQLNLVTGGMAITGSVTNNGIGDGVKKGSIGGIFGLYGTEKVRQMQEAAVKGSRLHIPLIFGLMLYTGIVLYSLSRWACRPLGTLILLSMPRILQPKKLQPKA